MENFELKYEQLKNEILDFITNKAKENSNYLELVKVEDIESENLWEYPQVMSETRHGYACYYHIINITFENDKLNFNAIDVEAECLYTFSPSELTLEVLVNCTLFI